MTGSVRQELLVHDALYTLIVDHPMWIDGKGRGLDYSPKRESLIGDFLDSAVEVLAPVIADAEKRGAVKALRNAADDWELRGLTLTAQELRVLAARAEAPACPWPSGPCLGEPCPDRGCLGRRAALDPS